MPDRQMLATQAYKSLDSGSRRTPRKHVDACRNPPLRSNQRPPPAPLRTTRYHLRHGTPHRHQRRDCAQAAAQLGPAGDAKIAAQAGVKAKTVARWRHKYNITTQHQPTLPTPNTRTLLTQAARRQYNRRTNWIPDRFLTNRRKSGLLQGHSVLEAVHGYTNQWIRLRLQNPQDHTTTQPPSPPNSQNSPTTSPTQPPPTQNPRQNLDHPTKTTSPAPASA